MSLKGEKVAGTKRRVSGAFGTVCMVPMHMDMRMQRESGCGGWLVEWARYFSGAFSKHFLGVKKGGYCE